MNSKIVIGLSIIASLLIGFFAGREYAFYEVRQRLDTALEEAFSPTADTAGSNNQEETSPVLAEQEEMKEELSKLNITDVKMGEEFELATIKVKVNSIERSDILNKEYMEPVVAPEGTEFIVIDMTLTNTTKADFTYTTDGKPLIDSQDTVYSPADYSNSADNNLDLETLSPNIPKTGTITYQVPKNDETYKLLMLKAGTDDAFAVTIK